MNETEQKRKEVELEGMADRIESVLKAGGSQVRIKGGTVLPHCVRFAAALYPGTRLSQVKELDGTLAATLGAPVQVRRRGAHAVIEAQRKDGATTADLLEQSD